MTSIDEHPAFVTYAKKLDAAQQIVASVNLGIKAAMDALAEHDRKRRALVRAVEDAYEAAEEPNRLYRETVDAAHQELQAALGSD